MKGMQRKAKITAQVLQKRHIPTRRRREVRLPARDTWQRTRVPLDTALNLKVGKARERPRASHACLRLRWVCNLRVHRGQVRVGTGLHVWEARRRQRRAGNHCPCPSPKLHALEPRNLFRRERRCPQPLRKGGFALSLHLAPLLSPVLKSIMSPMCIKSDTKAISSRR